MKYLRKLLPLLLMALALASCTVPSFKRGPAIPTLGPVQSSAGKNTYLQISASTNCAQVGETVTITARIRNRERYPVIISGTPPIDIVVHPNLWPQDKPRPTRRWSESSHYPETFDLVLDPEEEHIYTWNWPAEAINNQDPQALVVIDLIVPHLLGPNGNTTLVDGSTNVFVAVNRMPLASGGYEFCTSLPR